MVGPLRKHAIWLLVLASCVGEIAGDERAPDVDAAVPADGAPPAETPLRIAVISDLNGDYGSTEYRWPVANAVTRVIDLGPDLVLTTGDMVAGEKTGLDYAAMWSAFHAAVTDRLEDAGLPFAVTPGNHDASGYAAFAGERALFASEWTARRPAVQMVDDTHYPFHYAFRMGPALFVSLDATVIAPLPRVQREWLDALLTAQAAVPVKIVFSHVPIHPFTHGRETEILDDPALEAVLVRHGVDLMLTGHHHGYYPGKHDQLRVASTACLGGGQRALLGEETVSPRSIVWIELTSAGIVSLEAYGGAGYDELMPRQALPESLGSGEHLLVRDDLAE